MQSCGSYTVNVTFENTGTLPWSSANHVACIPVSTDGFTFTPSSYPIADGVSVNPGQSFTFPFIVNVPCSMKNGTYTLSFSLAYTLNSTQGPKQIPFGDVLSNNMNVATQSISVSAMGIIKMPRTTQTQIILPTISMKNPTDLMQQMPESQSGALFIIPVQGDVQVKGSVVTMAPQIPITQSTSNFQNTLVSSHICLKRLQLPIS